MELLNTTKRIAVVFGAISTLCMSTGSVRAAECSHRTTVGSYVVVCDGHLSPGPGQPLMPAKLLGTVTADDDGHYMGTSTLAIGGQILTQKVTGTEQINDDCTGNITYKQTLNGQPAPDFHDTFVVTEHGNRIDGISVDPGTVFSCVLRRYSASVDR